jgi:hypothetical protein
MPVSGASATARLAAVVALAAVGAGCASPPQTAAPASESCTALLQAVDARVAAAGVGDGGARRIPGFPHLRVNRFLAALQPEPGSAAFAAWVARLRELDASARRAELANLGMDEAQRGRVEACAAAAAAVALDEDSARRLLASAVVPDDYAGWQRALGLYPLTSLGLLAGVERLRGEIEADFATPRDALPVRGRLVRFVPPTGPPRGEGAAPAPLGSLARDALGVPLPDAATLEQLYRDHAPVFEVDVVRPDDRVGEVGMDDVDAPRVDPARPVVYRYLDHALLDGEVLLQLVYVAWFRSRPLTGALDILGGDLDGLVWRVTLDGDGQALAYDSIHPCGCYHLVFPSDRLRLRAPTWRYEEPVLSPGPAPPGAGRMVLSVAERTHFIRQLSREAWLRGGVVYRFAPYDALRSLPLPGGGRHSLFAPDGLVPGTERGERWLLWMAGIQSPGAMRQAGRHAIAFVGRRHFDDPHLLARYYERTPPGEG